MNLYEILDFLNIRYQEIEHKAVFTIDEMDYITENISGILCKNLFLTDKKHFYLIILREDKKADLKFLASVVGSKHFSFASEDRLKQILNLERGSVTPFGIMFDKNNEVTLLIDKDLQNKVLLFHPNVNTRTLSISYPDFIRFLEYEQHKYLFF